MIKLSALLLLAIGCGGGTQTTHKTVTVYDTVYKTTTLKDTIWEVNYSYIDSAVYIPVYIPKGLQKKIKSGAIKYTIEIKGGKYNDESGIWDSSGNINSVTDESWRYNPSPSLLIKDSLGFMIISVDTTKKTK